MRINHTAETPILLPFITPENIHRRYESCSDKNAIALIASHQANQTYSNPADKFAASMAKIFDQQLKDNAALIPAYTKATVEHDELASYVMMARNTGKLYVTSRAGMTIIKGKVLSYWIVNYSDKPLERPLDLRELQQWIANAHKIN